MTRIEENEYLREAHRFGERLARFDHQHDAEQSGS